MKVFILYKLSDLNSFSSDMRDINKKFLKWIIDNNYAYTRFNILGTDKKDVFRLAIVLEKNGDHEHDLATIPMPWGYPGLGIDLGKTEAEVFVAEDD